MPSRRQSNTTNGRTPTSLRPMRIHPSSRFQVVPILRPSASPLWGCTSQRLGARKFYLRREVTVIKLSNCRRGVLVKVNAPDSTRHGQNGMIAGRLKDDKVRVFFIRGSSYLPAEECTEDFTADQLILNDRRMHRFAK